MKGTYQTSDLLAQLFLEHGQFAGLVVEQAAHVFETMLFTFLHQLESFENNLVKNQLHNNLRLFCLIARF